MARTGYRIGRSNLVSTAIEGRNGWDRDPYAVGAVPTWVERFPGLPMVADGREVTHFTRAGRGTTAFDLFRQVESCGIIRTDFLSLKTDTIGPDGKLPSKVELATGNVETLSALLDGINRGAALPTLVFASENDDNGDPLLDGFAIVIDLGEVLRNGIAPIEAGPYGKGQAPPAYFRWSAARPCGGKGKRILRENLTFPHIDEQGRRWVAPDKVCYSELVCSFAGLGLTRADWRPVHVSDLPGLVETLDWNILSL